MPFTIALLILITIIGVRTKVHRGERLSKHWIDKFGFAPKDLWSIRVRQLFFSLFLTNNRRSYLQAIILILTAVGSVEWLTGTLRAFLTFWGIHTMTLIILSLFIIFPLHQLKITLGKELALVKDVGPSAGYFGCLGLMACSFSPP